MADADVIETQEAAHARACGLTVPAFKAAVEAYGDPGKDPSKTVYENWLIDHARPESSARRLNHRCQGATSLRSH